MMTTTTPRHVQKAVRETVRGLIRLVELNDHTIQRLKCQRRQQQDTDQACRAVLENKELLVLIASFLVCNSRDLCNLICNSDMGSILLHLTDKLSINYLRPGFEWFVEAQVWIADRAAAWYHIKVHDRMTLEDLKHLVQANFDRFERRLQQQLFSTNIRYRYIPTVTPFAYTNAYERRWGATVLTQLLPHQQEHAHSHILIDVPSMERLHSDFWNVRSLPSIQGPPSCLYTFNVGP